MISAFRRLLPPRRAAIIGYVDHVGDGLIRGWAADMNAPGSRLALDVFHRGIFLGCARAGGFRRDLRDQGIGDGCYGFVFHSDAFRAGKTLAEDLVVMATDRSRVRLEIAAPECAPPLPGAAARGPITDAKAFFSPLLEALATRDARPPRVPLPLSATARRIEILCANGGVGNASAFVEHIAHKYDRPRPSDDLACFWSWYLETYAVEQGDARAPLSAADLDHLGRAGRPGSRSRRFDRAVHEARRLYVEDCLVEPRVRDDLAAVPLAWRSQAFPLSRFMRFLRRRHRLLRDFRVCSKQDRVQLYAVFMLLALRETHYLIYLPGAWIDRMLEGGTDGSLFERAQLRMFDTQAPLMTNRAYCRHIASRGFDLRARNFSRPSETGHRVAVARAATDEVVDVQMIGPFKQSLGLAESCRRVAAALRSTGLSLNFVDHRVGSLPQHDDATAIVTGEARKARVNLLHLNAEEVPEAMAYRPALLSEAHTIVIPYWELSKPSSVHRLGLALVDEVWAATRFLADVFAGAKPVTYIGMSYDDGFDIAKPAAREVWARCGISSDHFAVLTVADALSWSRRKNVLGAIDAFQAAFPGDDGVRLLVKTRNVAAAMSDAQVADWRTVARRRDDDPRIVILDAELSPQEQRALLVGADCLLSLHRAEGLGLGILDALHCGTPVVASAYSGNMDFCDATTAWLVDYELTPVEVGHYAFVEPGHVWAEPQRASAVAALREVRGDAAARARKTEAGKALVRATASPDRFAARMAALLSDRLRRLR